MLIWFKVNCQHYYGNINIDKQRLALLPEDDVPYEISGFIRQLEDDDIAAQEEGGYVMENSVTGLCNINLQAKKLNIVLRRQ